MKRLHLVLIFTLVFVLLSACSKQTVRTETTIGKEVLDVRMPVGEVVHPQYGKEDWFGLGAMNGANKVNANGVAQSHVFANGTTVATVNLNIQPAGKNSQYVAWLQKPGTTERVRLDSLVNPLNDVRHVITVDIEKDLRAYTEVVVTLERSSGASDSDPVQATGTLKQQKR